MEAASAVVDKVIRIRVLVETGRYRHDHVICRPRKECASIFHVLFTFFSKAAGSATINPVGLAENCDKLGGINRLRGA